MARVRGQAGEAAAGLFHLQGRDYENRFTHNGDSRCGRLGHLVGSGARVTVRASIGIPNGPWPGIVFGIICQASKEKTRNARAV